MKARRTPLPTVPRLETVELADLVPHPDQQKFFREYGEYEYAQLKADIDANGVKVPPDVMPPKNTAGLPALTVIKGHTRSKIWRELGHATIRVVVRWDLINVERAIIDEEFLRDNVARRQQDKLGQARAAVGLYQIERQKKGKRVIGDPLQVGEVRDRVGRIIGMSGRNLLRYVHVLSAPPEVQDAFQAGDIKLVTAARVAGLPKGEQEALAARLRAGEDANAVFTELFPPSNGKHVKVGDAVAAFARSIEKGAADLDGRVAPISARLVGKHQDVLRRGLTLIRELLAKLDQAE